MLSEFMLVCFQPTHGASICLIPPLLSSAPRMLTGQSYRSICQLRPGSCNYKDVLLRLSCRFDIYSKGNYWGQGWQTQNQLSYSCYINYISQSSLRSLSYNNHQKTTNFFTSASIQHINCFSCKSLKPQSLQQTLQQQHPETPHDEILNSKWEATVSGKLSTLQ